jgi:hypothetical protein
MGWAADFEKPARNSRKSAQWRICGWLSNLEMGRGGGRTWARTKDPLIKSQLLYQLSYASTLAYKRSAGGSNLHQADAGFGGRTWARTKDPLIKSQLLYQLSYASIPLPVSLGG